MPSQHSPRPLRLRYRATVQLFDGKRQLEAQVLNVSEGGVFVAVEPPVPIGTGVSFWLRMAAQRLSIRGHVRWTRSIEASEACPVGSGIEFYDPDGALAEQVRVLLTRLTDPGE